MAAARSLFVDPTARSFYRCGSRCARRAFFVRGHGGAAANKHRRNSRYAAAQASGKQGQA